MEDMVNENLFQGIYKGKKVFVTGHTGFKGSWLIARLHLLGAEVRGYALKPEKESLYNCIDGDNLSNSFIGDIRAKETLKESIVSFEPDFLFHLAAQPLVINSYEIPTDTFEINVSGTSNVLDAIRFLKKQCSVVIITTDKVYKNKDWVFPYRENDSLGGYDPYSASKACAELVVSSYRNSFFNPTKFSTHRKTIATARAGNVIGGGDWSKDRIIPDIIRALKNEKDIAVRNPESIRPWQHVLEPIEGYLLLGAAIKNDPQNILLQTLNFGPISNDVLPVSTLVKKAIDRWGGGNFYTPESKNHPHEAAILKLDITKANELLNWYPKLNSETAINWTIDWYKQPDVIKQREFTFKQIKEFSVLL